MPMLRKLIFTIWIIQSLTATAQEEVPFTIRYKELIQGDITFIANTIVNRNTGKNYNEPYNKLNSGAKHNDDFEMQYIDIDQNPETFSSSSATFQATEPMQELLFAGLYWSATYKYDIGFTNKNHKEDGNFERSDAFHKVKLQTPNSQNYKDIEGKIVFDGFDHPKLGTNAPYLCFADITSLVKEHPYGTYTLANMRTTQGFIEGGVSGGWVIYFIYKEKNARPKQITLYDGFTYVYNKPISLHLNDFSTPENGKINLSVTMAALEGDLNIDGDNIRIKNLSNGVHFPISSTNRDAQNIFNSQISQFGQNCTNRYPASLNTLGFDVFQENINNKNNIVIANNCKETEIKITSLGDKVYVFNLAFAIDVDQKYFEDKLTPQDVVTSLTSSPVITPKEILVSTNKTLVSNPTKEVKKENEEKKVILTTPLTDTKKNESQDSNIRIESQKIDTTLSNDNLNLNQEETTPLDSLSTGIKIKSIKINIKPIDSTPLTESVLSEEIDESKLIYYEEKRTLTTPDEIEKTTERENYTLKLLKTDETVPSGFYLISEVFNNEANASKYIHAQSLKNKLVHYFKNNHSKNCYAYLKYSRDLNEIETLYYNNLNQTYFSDFWILQVSN